MLVLKAMPKYKLLARMKRPIERADPVLNSTF